MSKKIYILFILICFVILPKQVFAEETVNTCQKEINGHFYCIQEDGSKKVGFVKENGKTYFYSRVKGYALKGWVRSNVGEGTWYQDVDGSLLTGLQTIDKHIYYFDNNGKLQVGFRTIDNKKYFFSRTYEYALTGWVRSTVGEGTWYQEDDGSLKIGLQTIDKHIYYFDNNGKLQTGFITYGGEKYFFSRTYEYALSGWARSTIGEGTWYQNDDGSLKIGIQEIDGKKYYFDSNGKLQTGFFQIDGKWYYLGDQTTKQGWNSNADGKWYQNEDGSLLTGLQIIDGKKYYFGENGKLQVGFQTIDGINYFFSRTYGYALNGWVRSLVGEGTWYQGEDGSLKIGIQEIDNHLYYFNKEGKQQTGFIRTEDGVLHFFSRTYGYALPAGWQSNTADGKWYQTEEGVVYDTPGYTEIDGKGYYFENHFVVHGIRVVDGNRYYFDDVTGEKVSKTFSKNYREYQINQSTGKIIKVQYYPPYYSQTDPRWGNRIYNGRTFASTGCVPASLAMAFTCILNRTILPSEIGDYLYYNTDQYNKRMAGTSGYGIIYASNYYGVKYTTIYTEDQLIDELKKGYIVYASMQEGRFATKAWHHAIIMYGYNNNSTYAFDPLDVKKNGYVSVDLIWNEKNRDPDDTSGGSAIYSLHE